MKVRYCETKRAKYYPCDIQWFQVNWSKPGEYKRADCHDEPKESKCGNLVEVDECEES